MPAVQVVILGINFYSVVFRNDGSTEYEIQPTEMYFDFGVKFLVVFFMHMIVKPDMKQAMDLMMYLEKPTTMVHVNSSRFLACILLLLKFAVGLFSETLLILTLAAYPKANESDI